MSERFMARVQDNLGEPVPDTHNIKLTIYVIIRLVWLQLPHYSWPSCLITDQVNTESMMRQESHRTLRQRVKKPGFTSELAECTMLGGISAKLLQRSPPARSLHVCIVRTFTLNITY